MKVSIEEMSVAIVNASKIIRATGVSIGSNWKKVYRKVGEKDERSN